MYELFEALRSVLWNACKPVVSVLFPYSARQQDEEVHENAYIGVDQIALRTVLCYALEMRSEYHAVLARCRGPRSSGIKALMTYHCDPIYNLLHLDKPLVDITIQINIRLLIYGRFGFM